MPPPPAVVVHRFQYKSICICRSLHQKTSQ
jgi:hypothetical protein